MQAAIILVRLDSSRFPQKALAKINDNMLIEHVAKSFSKDNVFTPIIATTNRTVDNPLVEIAKKNNIKIFRGEYENISKRVTDCIKEYNIEFDKPGYYVDAQSHEVGWRGKVVLTPDFEMRPVIASVEYFPSLRLPEGVTSNITELDIEEVSTAGVDMVVLPEGTRMVEFSSVGDRALVWYGSRIALWDLAKADV